MPASGSGQLHPVVGLHQDRFHRRLHDERRRMSFKRWEAANLQSLQRRSELCRRRQCRIGLHPVEPDGPNRIVQQRLGPGLFQWKRKSDNLLIRPVATQREQRLTIIPRLVGQMAFQNLPKSEVIGKFTRSTDAHQPSRVWVNPLASTSKDPPAKPAAPEPRSPPHPARPSSQPPPPAPRGRADLPHTPPAPAAQ